MTGVIVLLAGSLQADTPEGLDPKLIDDIRLKAREASALGDEKATRAAYKGVADLAWALLEEAPEAQWDPDQLRGFLIDFGTRWLTKLSPEQQKVWFSTRAAKRNDSSRKLVLAYGQWLAGQGPLAILLGGSIIGKHPDSVAAEIAIQVIIGFHYYRGNSASFNKALSRFIDVAPDNRSVGWALCSNTWKSCHDGQPKRGYDFNVKVIESRPGTLASDVAKALNQMLVAIDVGDFDTALKVLLAFPEYYYRESIPDYIVRYCQMLWIGSDQAASFFSPSTN